MIKTFQNVLEEPSFLADVNFSSSYCFKKDISTHSGYTSKAELLIKFFHLLFNSKYGEKLTVLLIVKKEIEIQTFSNGYPKNNITFTKHSITVLEPK